MFFFARKMDVVWVKLRDVVWGSFERFWGFLKRHQIATYTALFLILIVPFIFK